MKMSVSISNFKSIRAATLDLTPGLNVLVGPNGAGKTSFFSALKFVRDVLTHGAARAVALAGGPRHVYYHGSNTLTLCVTTPYGVRVVRRRSTQCNLRWEFSVSQTGSDTLPTLTAESITITASANETEPLFVLSLRRSSNKPSQPSLQRHLVDPEVLGRNLFSSWEHQYSHLNRQSIHSSFLKTLGELGKAAREPDASLLRECAGLDKKIAALFSAFRSLHEYNILPDVARAPSEPLPFASMKPDGGGVAEVIHALTEQLFHKFDVARQDLLEYSWPSPYVARNRYYLHFYPLVHLRASPSQSSRDAHTGALDKITSELAAGVKPLSRVSTRLDPTTGKRHLVFHSEGGGEFLPQEVSDGTVKWLCILVSLFVPSSQVYLLEEPENFLHPWMQQRLIASMREQAKAAHTMFFITTHSATVLNACEPAEVVIVTPTAEGTRIERLPNRLEIEAVLAESEFRLGDLWVSGAIAGVPSNE